MIQFLFFFFSMPLFAANWQEAPKSSITTEFGISVPSLSMTLQNRDNSAVQKLELQPNVRGKAFISAGYGIFGATIGWVGLQDPNQDRLFGGTDGTDYQFRFYFHKFNAEFFYQTYKGYFLKNTDQVIPGFNSNNPRILYPNLSTEHFGMSLTYNFSKDDFSASAGFDQFARQTESGGTWMANVSADAHRFSNSGTLIPSQIAGTYGSFESMKGGQFYTASIGGGYGYDLVIAKSWFAAAQFLLNLGTQWQNFNSLNGNTTYNNTGNTQGHLKLGIGYNSDQFITAFRMNIDNTMIPVSNTDMGFNTSEVAIYVGWRWLDCDIPFLNWQPQF